MNKKQTCCFIGQREIKEYALPMLLMRLKSEIKGLAENGVDTYISGGAAGFDTLCAAMVIALQDEFPHIKLVFALPCKDHGRFGTQSEKGYYKELLQEAHEVIYVSEKYDQECMHQWNRYLVDNSYYCICYLEKKNGNAVYTVEYAVNKGLTVIDLSKYLWFFQNA